MIYLKKYLFVPFIEFLQRDFSLWSKWQSCCLLDWGKGKVGAKRPLSLSLPDIHELCHFDGVQRL